MRYLVDLCYLTAAGVLAPLVAYRAYTTGKYRADWPQRRGFMPELPASSRRAWIHAVSVGEVNACRGLVELWRNTDPQVEIVISTTTDTGMARARSIFPGLTIVRYPLDFSWFVQRALERIRPSMVVLVELEVWYNFATLAAARGIPVAVVNGRLSQRSVERFGLIRAVARRMFEALAWVGAQDETYAQRFVRMGVPRERVSVTGSVKWDGAQVADSIPGADVLASAVGLKTDQPIWVAGSTGPGEEQVLLEALRRVRAIHPDVQLVIVPRKPERFDEVAELIRRAGYPCVRRSKSPDGGRASCPPSSGLSSEKAGGQDARPPKAVVLGDTMGELRKFYSLATVVFVGRTLADMGGSDMMEVAALGKPVVVGRHCENFADVVARLQAGDGIRILSTDLTDANVAERLAEVVSGWLADRAAAEMIGTNGREVVLANRGATQRTLEALMEMLNRVQHRAS